VSVPSCGRTHSSLSTHSQLRPACCDNRRLRVVFPRLSTHVFNHSDITQTMALIKTTHTIAGLTDAGLADLNQLVFCQKNQVI